MATYILIKKASETEDWVDYEFWEDDDNVGCLRLDKKIGKVIELREIKGSHSEAVFTRASWSILRHFVAGEFPEQTCWAS